MRLIDADELRTYIDGYIERRKLSEHDRIVFEGFKGIIDNAPTINFAVPINIKEMTAEEKETLIKGFTRNGFATFELYDEKLHGEWLHDDKYLDVKCSICNSYSLDRGDYPELSKYCPACGALMKNPEV